MLVTSRTLRPVVLLSLAIACLPIDARSQWAVAEAKARRQEARTEWAKSHEAWVAAHDALLGAVLGSTTPVGTFSADADGQAGREADRATTAIAIMVLLDSGSTAVTGPQAAAVQHGIQWLHDLAKRGDGTLYDRDDPNSYLVQSLGVIALARCGHESASRLLNHSAATELRSVLARRKNRVVDPLALAIVICGLRRPCAATNDPLLVEAWDLAAQELDDCIETRGQIAWRGTAPPFTGAGPDPTETAAAGLLTALAHPRLPKDLAVRLEPALPRLEQAPRRWADGKAIDGLTLALGAEAAFAAGGTTRDTWVAAIEQQILPLLQFENGNARDVNFACGHEVLMHPTTRLALLAWTLGIPLR